MQAADVEEEAGQHGTDQDEETRGDEAAEEAHVLAGGQHIGGQAEEHQGGHGEGGTDHLAAVGHVEVPVEDRAQGVAHEAGEGEGGDQAPGRITQLHRQEEQPVETDQHHEDAGVGHAHLLGEVGDQAAERKCQGQQPVGIAQDAADFQLLGLCGVEGIVLFVHRDTPEWFP
ncbi:hypothetical protein D9M68_682340 [compost metagenome]